MRGRGPICRRHPPAAACRMSPSCAARSPMPAFAASIFPQPFATAFSPQRTSIGVKADPGGVRHCPASRSRSSRRSRPARCGTSASLSRCASPRPAPRPRMSPRASRSTSTSCRRSATCCGRASPAPPSCTSIGATMSSSTTAIDVDIAAVRRRADRGHARNLRPRASAWRRSRARGVRRRHATTAPTSSCSITATQMPHIIRTGLAECLGLEEGRVRVISPDVGGGFGYKGDPARRGGLRSPGSPLRRRQPVRWIEDRREHLTAGANCREHHYRDHRLRRCATGGCSALDCEATVDAGAYSVYPFSACLEAAQVGQHPAGSLRSSGLSLPHLVGRDQQVARSCPIAASRGTGVCFALELTLDAVARGGRPRARRGAAGAISCRPEQMPFDNITKKHFDSGDYPEALRARRGDRPRCDARAAAARRARRPPASASASRSIREQAAHGTSVYAGWGIPMVPGFEQASARLTPDGGLEMRVGAPFARPGAGDDAGPGRASRSSASAWPGSSVVHGDTAMTPYSTGTWGSRCMVMAGGAVADACRAARRAGDAHRRASPAGAVPKTCAFENGRSQRPGRRGLARRDRARPGTGARRIFRPTSIAGGLEVTAGYKAEARHRRRSATRRTRPWSRSIPRLGEVEILDYVVVEDGGVLVNPMIVDGQIVGGVAQGIGTALYEEMPLRRRRPAAGLDLRRLPAAGRDRGARVSASVHMETPSPYTRFGRRASAKAAPSRRRPRSPTPSTTR